MSHLEKEPNPNLSDQAPGTGATATGSGATPGARVSGTVGGMGAVVLGTKVGFGAAPRVERIYGTNRRAVVVGYGGVDAGASAVAGRMDLNVGRTAVGVTVVPTSGISMSNSSILMTTSQSAVTPQPLTQEQFQQLRQEYQEILDIKDRELQIKEETIGACRQEIDYLRAMVDELLKQPTLAELVGLADQIKENLKPSQTSMNP